MRAKKHATREKRDGFWSEWASTATKVEDIITGWGESESSIMKFHGHYPEYLKFLGILGDMGFMDDLANRKIHSQLENKGKNMCGNANNHNGIFIKC